MTSDGGRPEYAGGGSEEFVYSSFFLLRGAGCFFGYPVLWVGGARFGGCGFRGMCTLILDCFFPSYPGFPEEWKGVGIHDGVGICGRKKP